MKLVKTVAELQQIVKETKKAGKSIGLVPTMGALHEGHASLIKAAHAENDFTIVSDFASPNEMYPSRDMTWVEVTGDTTKVLCGRTRPIHFRGVATVVSKLFNLAQPDKAYFGQKDAQQAQVLKRMVKDLFFPLEIRVMPIVREADGLAKSSRNVYLNKAERSAAVILSKALAKAKAAFEAGERDSAKLIALVTEMIQTEPLSNIDYVEMYQLPDLTPAEKTVKTDHLLAVAVKFGTTRLIDNIILQK